MKKLLLVFFALIGLLLSQAFVIQSASASTIAASVSGTQEFADNDSNGWRFQALSDITVLELGVWDMDSDGLGSAVDVGLWSDGGTLLSSTAVAAGTSGRLEDSFRFTAISALDLIAGQFYRVAASPQSGSLSWLAFGATQSFSSEIAYDNGYYNESDNVLSFPNSPSLSDLGIFGANFTYENTAIPEPATLLLFGIGILGFAGVSRRKK